MRLAKLFSSFVLASALSLSAIACGSSGDDDDDDFGPCYDDPAACVDDVGVDYQYVADTITMPTSATQAQQLGLDLDGDPQGRPDNALGQILSTLASQGDVDLQESIDEQVLEGGLLLLFTLKATGLTTAADAGGWVLLGDNPTPEPCTDPLDILTCGQHLDGNGTFTLAAGSPTDAVLHGNIIASKFTGGPGKITLELSLGDVAGITVNLIGARMEVSVSETGLTSGKIGGAITDDELNNSVLPAIVTVMDESIGEDCLGSPPTCCVEGSTGETLIDLFDDCSDGSTSCDCAVDLEELRTNDLISSLLAPDVDLLDADGSFNPRKDEVKDALSLGIGFTATTASF
jgi:hypothetical protein